MKILLVAPDSPGINAIPEVRNLSALHRVQVLNGPVTAADVYAAAERKVDIIHFACHVEVDRDQRQDSRLVLTGTERFTAEDILRVVGDNGAVCVFFNSCLAARLASRLHAQEVPYVIGTTIELPDRDAWKGALAFYRALTRQEASGAVSIVEAYNEVDTGDGVYILLQSQMIVHELEPILAELKLLKGRIREQAMQIRLLLGMNIGTVLGMAWLLFMLWRMM